MACASKCATSITTAQNHTISPFHGSQCDEGMAVLFIVCLFLPLFSDGKHNNYGVRFPQPFSLSGSNETGTKAFHI